MTAISITHGRMVTKNIIGITAAGKCELSMVSSESKTNMLDSYSPLTIFYFAYPNIFSIL